MKSYEHFALRLMGNFKFFIAHSFILFSPVCQGYENFCPIKSTFNENYHFSTVPDVTCVKQHNCSIDASSSKGAFTMGLASAQITLDEEGLWVQLKLISKDVRHIQDTDTAYTAFVLFNREEFCYKFTIPAFIEKHIFLPFVQVPQMSSEMLKALTWVYETSSSGKSRLALLIANQYSLKDLPKKKAVEVRHLSKSLFMEKFSLRLAFNSPCPFRLNASVYEKSHHNEVCNTSGDPLCSTASEFIWRQVSLNCPQTFFKVNRTYCIQTKFSPLEACSSAYPELSTEISYFQKTCEWWNVSVTVSLISSRKIRVHFSPLHEYLGCFSCFNVLLYKVGKGGWSSQFRELHETMTVTLDEGEAIFPDLPTGFNYCPKIEPCGKSYWRRSSTTVVSILEGPSPVPIEPRDNVDILLASIILLSVATIAVWLQFRRLRKKKDVETPVHENPPAAPPCPPQQQVWVLEGRESGLVGLLRHCFGDSGVRSGLHPFLSDPVGWAQELLAAYQCPAMGDPRDSGHRFVFVQDGRPPDPSTIQGKMFCAALHALLSLRLERCQQDYCHLFVVQLGPPSDGGGTVGQLVPLKRYTPDDLVDLCLDLGFPQPRRPELQHLVEGHQFSPQELLGRALD